MRWERREARRLSVRQRVRKHGASLLRVYSDAVRKRLNGRAEGAVDIQERGAGRGVVRVPEEEGVQE